MGSGTNADDDRQSSQDRKSHWFSPLSGGIAIRHRTWRGFKGAGEHLGSSDHRLPDDMPVAVKPAIVCAQCGYVGADVRPDRGPHVDKRHVGKRCCIRIGSGLKNRQERLPPLRADIVAKVPNRQELIFLLFKKSTDDR